MSDAPERIWMVPGKIQPYCDYYKAKVDNDLIEYILASLADKREQFVKEDARRAWRETVKQLEDRIKELEKQLKSKTRWIDKEVREHYDNN